VGSASRPACGFSDPVSMRSLLPSCRSRGDHRRPGSSPASPSLTVSSPSCCAAPAPPSTVVPPRLFLAAVRLRPDGLRGRPVHGSDLAAGRRDPVSPDPSTATPRRPGGSPAGRRAGRPPALPPIRTGAILWEGSRRREPSFARAPRRAAATRPCRAGECRVALRAEAGSPPRPREIRVALRAERS
jgi:hypothetical protein